MDDHVLGIATEVIAMAIVISVILLFLGIGVLVLIHVCIVGRTLSERNLNMVERGSFGSTSMSQDDIEKLPCFNFKAKEKSSSAAVGSSPPADCAVCLENFRVGERCRLLPSCNHSFHAECVDLWLLRTPICPICRAGAECTKCNSEEEEEESNDLGVESRVLEEIVESESGNNVQQGSGVSLDSCFQEGPSRGALGSSEGVIEV